MKNQSMKLIITIALLLNGSFIIGQDRITKIDSLLNSLYSEDKINGNFLVAEKGEIIYNRSFGLANETTHEELNENSIFELASVSKQFTAMAIMILKENGKLSLDDDIVKFLPELSYYKNISIRNLLNHTGGLPDYMELLDKWFDKTKIATNQDIISIFTKYQPKILFKPDTKWEYSNTGYALLASIIEKVSGSTYDDYLNKNIFQPLGMNNTLVYTRRLSPKNIDNYAFGYIYTDSLKKYVLPDDLKDNEFVVWLDGIVGDGTVNSTVNDLLIWDRALYTNKLISEEGMKEIFEVATLKNGSKTQYALGWSVINTPDFGKIVNHGGGWPGYSTFIDRHVANDKTIIILQNHDNVTVPLKQIRQILYYISTPVKKEISLTTEELQKFVGTYELKKGSEIRISLDNDHLYIQFTGEDKHPLYAESKSLFFVKIADAQVEFQTNKKGKISSLTFINGDYKTVAKRKKQS